MAATTNELFPTKNLLEKVLSKIKIDEKAAATSKLAVLISVFSTLIALFALNDAKDARITVEHQQRYINELETDVGVWSNRATRLDAYLKSKGIDTGDIYDD